MVRLLLLTALCALAACAAVPPSAEPFRSDRISVEAIGSGPDVVLITGLASHPEVWKPTIAALPNYRYHLIHVAGFAGAPARGNALGPVVAPIAEEITRYVKTAGLDRPAIVGFSLGGAMAMMIGARHPDLPSRMMVVDNPPFLGPLVGQPEGNSETIRPFAEQMRQRIATATSENRRSEVEEAMAGQVRNERLRPMVVDHLLGSDPAVSGQAMHDLLVTDLRPELSKIRVPLTVLYVAPPGIPMNTAQVDQFYRNSFSPVPHAKLRRVDDSYHFIMLDQPQVFQRELHAFLEGR